LDIFSYLKFSNLARIGFIQVPVAQKAVEKGMPAF
jgi:hypothetical protein